MTAFAYSDCDLPIRDDIPAANRRLWARLAAPGTWWTGGERVAIAREVRRATKCALCRQRREALSPEAVQGEHDRGSDLPAVAIDTIHRIATDAGRLSRAWFERTRAAGLCEGHYVELLGIVANLVAVDTLHRGIGLALEPLPEPDPGAPSGYRPARACEQGAYVPLLPWDANVEAESDLWESAGGNVVRALSLVPDAVRELRDLASTYYMPIAELRKPYSNGGRALERAQIELLAGRVSALNECFY